MNSSPVTSLYTLKLQIGHVSSAPPPPPEQQWWQKLVATLFKVFAYLAG